MTQEETIEGNKLIAEFMGAVTPKTAPGIILPYIKNDEVWFGDGTTPNGQYGSAFKISDLKYHSSWDWLMPVVEKIESLPLINDAGICVLIEHSYCRIYLDNWGEYTTVAENATKKNKLSAVYLSVIEFIKWYNQNK